MISLRVALNRATETLAFVDVAGDDDAHELSADLLEDAAPYNADDLVEHFADDAPPDERVQARTHDARALIDTAPSRACQAMRLLGDPYLLNGVSDRSVRIEARTTLLATAAGLLVDGVPAAVRRHEVVNMAGEAIVLLGASVHYRQALAALDAWRRARGTPPFALLDATLAEGQERSDLEWLVELESLVRRRPADQRKRLTTGEREHLVQLLDTVERLFRSGQGRGRPHGGPARHPAGARSRPAARLRRGRRHAPGTGQGPHRTVLRSPGDAVPELDARRQPPLAADRRAVGSAVAGRVPQLAHPLHDEARPHRAPPLQPGQA